MIVINKPMFELTTENEDELLYTKEILDNIQCPLNKIIGTICYNNKISKKGFKRLLYNQYVKNDPKKDNKKLQGYINNLVSNLRKPNTTLSVKLFKFLLEDVLGYKIVNMSLALMNTKTNKPEHINIFFNIANPDNKED